MDREFKKQEWSALFGEDWLKNNESLINFIDNGRWGKRGELEGYKKLLLKHTDVNKYHN